MTKSEIDELRALAQKIRDLEPDEPFSPAFYQGLDYAAGELEEWLDRKEPEAEYTAACVELVERLAGDLPFDPSYPKVVCRQIVKNMKPTNPSNIDSIGGE